VSLNRFDLTGKVALVTGGGANGGLGHAMAVGLAGAGADVVVSDIDADGAITTSREIEALGRRSLAVTCDNACREEITALLSAPGLASVPRSCRTRTGSGCLISL
jgi:NAD(P)-dependent dehydrogenase (short-subunit alcohol dehydrogenase family)